MVVGNCSDISKFSYPLAYGKNSYSWNIGSNYYRVPADTLVYAVTDERFGTIGSVSKENTFTRLAFGSEHMLADKNNIISISDIDKKHYVALAESEISKWKR